MTQLFGVYALRRVGEIEPNTLWEYFFIHSNHPNKYQCFISSVLAIRPEPRSVERAPHFVHGRLSESPAKLEHHQGRQQ